MFSKKVLRRQKKILRRCTNAVSQNFNHSLIKNLLNTNVKKTIFSNREQIIFIYIYMHISNFHIWLSYLYLGTASSRHETCFDRLTDAAVWWEVYSCSR